MPLKEAGCINCTTSLLPQKVERVFKDILHLTNLSKRASTVAKLPEESGIIQEEYKIIPEACHPDLGCHQYKCHQNRQYKRSTFHRLSDYQALAQNGEGISLVKFPNNRPVFKEPNGLCKVEAILYLYTF